VWHADGYVYFSWHETDDGISDAPDFLWRVSPDGENEPERVALPEDCGGGIAWLRSYPDGRLGMRWGGAGPDNQLGISIWDLTRNQETVLIQGVDDVALDSTMTRGFAVDWSGYAHCTAIAPFTVEHGVGEFPHEVTIGNHTWRPDALLADPETECQDVGAMDWPHLLRTGELVVMATDGIPVEYGEHNQPVYEWALCRCAEPDVDQPEVVASGFRDVNGMTVFNDRDEAVVAASYEGEEGLWLVDLRDGEVRAIAEGWFASPSLSPDGTRVVALYEQDSNTVIDLPDDEASE